MCWTVVKKYFELCDIIAQSPITAMFTVTYVEKVKEHCDMQKQRGR